MIKKSDSFKPKHKFGLLGILFLAWFLGSFNKISVSVAAIPLTEEFGFTPNEMGMIMSSFFLSYALMSFLGGFWADKFGHRSVLTIMMMLWSGITAVTAVVWDFASMIVCRFLLGASEGGFGPASSVAIAERFPKSERGRAKSFLVSASALGVGTGGLLTAVLIVKFNWRLAFFLFGMLQIIVSIVFYLMMRKHKSKPTPTATGGDIYSLKHVFQIPLVLKLGIISFGAGITNWGLTAWLPSYWVNIHGLDMVEMGAMTLIPSLCLFVVMQISGIVLDKFMAGREKYVLFCGALLTALLMFFMMNAETAVQAIIYISLAFSSIGFVVSAMLVLPLKYLPVQIVGSATGFINFMQRMAGIVAPAIMGFLIAEYGGSFTPVFVLVISMLFISALTALMIRKNCGS